MTKKLNPWNHATLYVVLRVFGARVGFLNTLLIARLLGSREYGLMSLAFAAATLLATLAGLGLPYWITREVSISQQANQRRRLFNISRQTLQLCLLVSLLPATITAISYALLRTRLPTTFPFVVPASVVFLAAALIPLVSLNQIRAAIIRGLGHALTADFPDMVVRPLSISLAIGVALLLTAHYDAALGMTVQVCGTAISFSVGAVLLWKSMKTAIYNSGGLGEPTPSDYIRTKSLLREAPHFLLILLIATMDGQLSIYIIGFISGPSNVGIYQVALQPLNIILMGLIAVGAYAQPRIAATWAKRERSSTQEVINHATTFSSRVALIFGIALILLATPIIQLYGSSYSNAATLLRILAIGQIIHGITGPIGIVMLMTGNQKKLFYFDLLFLLLKIVMLSLAVHYFGLLGAALAEVIYLLIMRLTGAAFVRRHTGLVTTLWRRPRLTNPT